MIEVAADGCLPPGGLPKVPKSEVEVEYSQAVRTYRAAHSRLLVLVRRMAMETLGDVMPGVSTVIALGEFREDWIPTLRIQRLGLERVGAQVGLHRLR